MNLLASHRMNQIREASRSVDAWVTRDTDGTLCLSLKKPIKDKGFGWLIPDSGSGGSEANKNMFLDDKMFVEIKADEKEPRRVVITLL